MQYETFATLPQADQLSAEHSARVGRYLQQRIADAGGDLSFAEFMHEALYAPGLGYYSAGATKFGGAGDFTTAPEISPLFGRIVARQCSEALRDVRDSEVLEIGAGSGRLAADMLVAFESLGGVPPVYNILEVSPDLQARQRQRLEQEVPHLLSRVRWLSGLPDQFNGVVVANEVLDALPVERFVRRDGQVFQSCVSCSGDQFVWSERPASRKIIAAVAEIESDLGAALRDGYISELSFAAPAFVRDLSVSLQQGIAFLFDYGVSRREYYAPDRSDGWLRCHFRHHAHNDPLILPGIQDLTAWVDFSAIAAAAVDCGLDIHGFQTQSQFLMGGGLEQEMQNFEALPTARQLELSGQIKTLTLPGEMGENFKCMALGRGEIDTPSAFHFADRTQTL